MRSHYVRGLVSNWAVYGANIVVALFLSPFIVRTLGETGYGVWSLLMSLSGYLGLVDVGVRVSTGRFLNYYLGKGDRRAAGEIVSGSFALFTILGLGIMVAAGVTAALFGRLFPLLPPDLIRQSRLILPLLGANMWVGLYTATFSQLLLANNRFDLKNLIDSVSIVIRVIGTVAVLRAGYGIQGLAAVLAVTGVVECVLVRVLSLRWGVDLGPLSLKLTRERARELIHHSGWSLVANVGTRIINYTDSIVIAMLIGPGPLAIYAIGFMIVDYATNFIAQVVSVLTPDLYKAAGTGSRAVIAPLVRTGTSVTMAIAIPICIGLMTVGSSFTALWMGEAYRASGIVIVILAAAQLLAASTRGLGAALWGLGKVKYIAIATGIEAAANLGLSVWFVRSWHWGIYGVAAGTAIPMILNQCVFLTIYGCRETGERLRGYLAEVLGRWSFAAAAFALACLAVVSWKPIVSWIDLAVVVGGLAVVYAMILAIALGLPRNLRSAIAALTA